jgi:hypothetical protein
MPETQIAAPDQIHRRILILRNHRVLLDEDLARFYGVSTKVFNQVVKRNEDRFPSDFRFHLTHDEVANLRSQIVTSSSGHGGRRWAPSAFTEHGALMAASLLNSSRAIQMSLVIIRAFVELRRLMRDNRVLAAKLAELDAQVGAHDEQLGAMIEAIRQLAVPTGPEHGRKIGFNPPTKPESLLSHDTAH